MYHEFLAFEFGQLIQNQN